MFKIVRYSFVVSLFLFSANSALAAGIPGLGTLLPSTTLPETQSRSLAEQPMANPQTLPPAKAREEKKAPSPLGEAAAKIKFKLNKIILQGNKVYSDAELAKIYKDKMHKMITVAQLQDIVQDITNYYRNNGYILSRAVLPPQHVNNGIVKISIIEGYIDQVKVIGNPKGATWILERMGTKITADRPMQVKNLERNLLIANQIPGVETKAVLEPSKTNVGASNLNLATETKTFGGYVSYDNYGTRYIGPLEGSLGLEVNSFFVSGDSTQLNTTRTTKPQSLKFVQGLYNLPLGINGARFIVSGNQAVTNPLFVLRPLKVHGVADTYYGMVQYPLMRSRTQNLTFDGSFNYIDSRVVSNVIPGNPLLLYDDHLRSLRAGLSYDLSDRFNGANAATAHIEFGVPWMNPTTIAEGYSGFTSRFGASNHFAKAELMASRMQQFGATRYSAFIIGRYQYAMEPLLASEQFSFGGAQGGLGRGYDSAEIIGDRGLAGSLEFRANFVPDKALLSAFQAYAFYDVGVIWNLKTVADQATKLSAASVGLGSRFFFSRYVTGNLFIAQPITKEVAALELIGKGKIPRIFFSVTATA